MVHLREPIQRGALDLFVLERSKVEYRRTSVALQSGVTGSNRIFFRSAQKQVTNIAGDDRKQNEARGERKKNSADQEIQPAAL